MSSAKHNHDTDLKAAFGDLAGNVSELAKAEAELLEVELKQQLEKAARFVRERPLTCLLGAAVAGYLVARITRGSGR